MTIDGPRAEIARLPEGARCAEHPLSLAAGTCVRCGNYMCAVCAKPLGHQAGNQAVSQPASPSDYCRTCAVRFGSLTFPFTRDNWTVEGVCNFSFGLWKQHWAPLAGVTGLCLAVMYGLGFVTSIAQIFLEADGELSIAMMAVFGFGMIAQGIAQAWMQLAMQAVSLHLVRTGRVDLNVALRSVARVPHAMAQLALVHLPFLLVAALIAAAVFGLNLHEQPEELVKPLLFASPFIGAGLFYYLTSLLFMQMALVDEPPLGPLRAVEASMRAVASERPRLLLMMSIMGAAVLVGLLACCVGMVFSIGLANLMLSTLYLTLKQPADRTDQAGWSASG